MTFLYNHLALGGTFDLFHRGHQAFLEFAFTKAKKVSIGITSDQMAHQNGKGDVQSYRARRKAVVDFLKSNDLSKKSMIITLDDVFGSTITDLTIEALAVTSQTIAGGHLINQERKLFQLNPLPILVCHLIGAQDGQPISTSRIKNGEINREGLSYFEFLTSHEDFILPEKLRPRLSKPLGRLYKNLLFERSREFLLITVGDETTRRFVKEGISPNLAIVDFKVNRQKIYSKISDLGFSNRQQMINVRNDPGTISQRLIMAISTFFQKLQSLYQTSAGSCVIKVDGEEDLSVLPSVLLAPLGTQIVYGQRDKGVVIIVVTEEEKGKFLRLLLQFKSHRK